MSDDALNVVDVAGSPRDMGRAHGEAMRSAIGEAMERWMHAIERDTRQPAGDYLASFAASTHFDQVPDLMEEIAGIAEGARQDPARMLAYQLMDEEWAFRLGVISTRRAAMEACTALGVQRADGTSLLAQNMDLPSHYDGSQVVLRLRPAHGPAVMVFTPAGMIGTTGLNDRGIGVCVNAIPQLRHSSTGLPVSSVLRTMLACETAAGAAEVARHARHATAQNYLVGGPDAVHDFEAAPGSVSEVPAAAGQLTHTNHPLASRELDPAVARDGDSTTVARLERLREQISPLGRAIDVEAARRALSDRTAPICEPRGGDWLTLGSVVMELTGDPVLHVAPGPPADTPYFELRFT